MNIGDIFHLNLAPIFCDGFHEDLIGTPEYDRVPTKYGCVLFATESPLDVPGAGDVEYYDWEDTETGTKLALDENVLELRVSNIDEDEDLIEGEVVGWYGFPTVKLSFLEFEEYAQLD